MKIKKVCEICGKEYIATYESSRFCSRACFGLHHRKRVMVKCAYCGKNIEAKRWKAKKQNSIYCNTECAKLDRTGKNVYTNEYIIKGNYAILKTSSKNCGEIDALIDIKNIEKCKKYYWYPVYCPRTKGYYIHSSRCRKIIKLHRFITGCPNNMVVDHINHNSQDNRVENLRICTKGENSRNMKFVSNTNTGEKYICYVEKINKYLVQKSFKGKKYFCKYFNSFDEAIIARNNVLKELIKIDEYQNKDILNL